MKVNRKKFLEELTSVSYGLTTHEVIEQSNCFIFKNGMVTTFDGEVYATRKTDLGIEAAIPAQDLLKMLQRMTEEEVEVTLEDNEFIVSGKRKKAGIRIHEEILSPIDRIPTPKRMKPAQENFSNYLLQVSRICGNDHSNPKTTYVHITSDRLEATDSYRLCRYDMETGIEEDILLPAQALLRLGAKNISKVSANISRVASGEGWYHIKLGKTRISICCGGFDYFSKKSLDAILDIQGEKIDFPKGLDEALDRASVMDSASGMNEGEVKIKIEKNKFSIRTEKDDAWYIEQKKVQYNGKKLSFIVNPNFLQQVLKQSYQVFIDSGKMMIKEDKMRFVVCLEKN